MLRPKSTISYGLTFKPAQVLNLEGYSDSDWASNLDDRKSVKRCMHFSWW